MKERNYGVDLAKALAIVVLAFAAHLLFALVEKARKSVFRV